MEGALGRVHVEARSREPAWIVELRRRKAAHLRRWPRALAQAMRRAPAEKPALPAPRRRPPEPGPASWMAVPRALDEAYRSRGSVPGRAFLADVLWGQYCLFQCIRLQDDVFDRHTADLALVYASDQFLIEAERTFARHFPRASRFWESFRSAVESTTRAIVQVDELQKRLGCAPARLAREYANVGAIFKVGTTAVCLKHRRGADVAALDRFADDYAAGDQILDDLEDVEDDLRRGRFNYVAQKICAGRRRRGTADAEEAGPEIAQALARGNGADRILDDAARHFERALTTADGLRLPAVGAVAAAARRSVRELQAAFHRAQVTRMLGPILGSDGMAAGS